MKREKEDVVDDRSSDERDIHLSLQGDSDAYARLVRRHQHPVATRIRRFTRDRSEQGELVHEVFVQAFLSLSTFRHKAPFAHWLARITTNVGYKHWKRKSAERSGRLVRDDRLENLGRVEPEELEPKQAADLLDALLEKLPPRDRLILTLRYVEGNSIAETALLIGWSQAMVKVQAWRARKKLKRLFEEAGVEVDQ